MSFVPQLQPVPAGLVALADFQSHARTVLDPATWAYLDAGAADEITARANRAAWDRIGLLPRVMRSLQGATTQVQLLGRTLAHPVLVAPVAYQRLAHTDGEMATAHAAAAQGAGMVLSTQSSFSLEEVAQAVRAEPARGPLWFQLYWHHDRGIGRDLVRRAEAAGYEALVLTVDAPLQGPRDAQRRSGFRLPPGITAANLAPYGAPQPSFAPVGWAELDALLAMSRLPVIVKGVLHPDDARQAARAGAAAVIVSNHGGRNLDTAPATAAVLPQAVEAVAGDIPLLVDGGIRRGTDVLKAMALGASAVLVGRPIAWGLAAAGAMGVANVLRLLKDELEIAMALCGCPRLHELPADLLLRA